MLRLLRGFSLSVETNERFDSCKLDDCVCVCVCKRSVREWVLGNRRALVKRKFPTFTNNSSWRSFSFFYIYIFSTSPSSSIFMVEFFFSSFSYYFHSHRFTHDCVQRSQYICFPIFMFFVRAEYAYVIYRYSRRHIDRRKRIPFELKWRHSNTYIHITKQTNHIYI